MVNTENSCPQWLSGYNNSKLPCSCELDICTVALLEVLIRPRAAFSFPILISNYPRAAGGRASMCHISYCHIISVWLLVILPLSTVVEGHLRPESATVTRCYGDMVWMWALGSCQDINYPPMSRSWLLLVRCGHRLDQSQPSSASPPSDWLRVPGGAPRRL